MKLHGDILSYPIFARSVCVSMNERVSGRERKGNGFRFRRMYGAAIGGERQISFSLFLYIWVQPPRTNVYRDWLKGGP